jgi:ArsR family transcriptional regulator
MKQFPNEKIVDATRLLRGVAHELRLSILCHLEEQPLTVSQLMTLTGASQSNLSQHLAKMRMMGLLRCERKSQQVFYQLADPAFAQIIEALKSIYCSTPPQAGNSPTLPNDSLN